MDFFRKYYPLFKWIIMIGAYGFLGYVLYNFDGYHDLGKQWERTTLSHTVWLLGIVALIPFNWLMEAAKWRYALSKLEKISIATAYKSVMTGITAGFFTPNRLGEFPGRVLHLKKENRLTGIVFGIIGTMSQTLVIFACGIPSSILFFSRNKSTLDPSGRMFFFLLFVIFFGFLYMSLPKISYWILKKGYFEKIKNLLQNITTFSAKHLMGLMGFSLWRYIVFGFQFYFMLRFCSVEISPTEAIISIATYYLFVTFTPSVAFSEAAVRGSLAIIFIGAYSHNTIGIMAAGIFIWLVNFVFPMVLGSIFLSKSKL